MSVWHARGIVFTLLLCMSVFVVGCSAPVVPSDGIVQFDDGEPVQSGSIEFRSTSVGTRYASRIAADGKFTLRDKDGVAQLPEGDYEVVVVQIVLTEDLPAEMHQHGHTVPRRYADYYTSGLRFSNLSNRSEPIRIELELTP